MSRRERAALAVLVVCAALAYGQASAARYLDTGAFVYDLGIHQQTVWLLSQGLEPVLSSRGLHAFGDHFNPIAGVFALVPGVGSSPLVLLWLQSLLLALGAVPLYLLARRRLSPLLSGAVCGLYLIQPAVLFFNLWDFHFNVVLIPSTLLAAWALESAQADIYALALTTILACNESAGFSVLFLAFPAARLRGRSWGLATAAAALLGLLLANASLRTYGQGSTQYLSLYSRYGASPAEILQQLALRPVEAAATLNSRENEDYLAALAAPLAGLPLLSPARLVPALPVLVGNLLSWRSGQRSVRYHYTAGILPFLLWALVDALGWLSRKRWTTILLGLLLLVACREALRRGPLMDPAEPPGPPGVADFLAPIPPGASVVSDNSLGVSLCSRRELFVMPNPWWADAWGNSPRALSGTLSVTFPPSPGAWRRGLDAFPVDGIALALCERSFPMPRADRWYMLDGLLRSRAYGVEAFDGRLLRLRHGAPWRPVDPRILRAAMP